MARKKSITLSLDPLLAAELREVAGSLGISMSSFVALSLQITLPNYRSLAAEAAAAKKATASALQRVPESEAIHASERASADALAEENPS